MRGKGKNGLLPSSLKIISSCLKTVSSNAGSVASSVRSAGASVAASITVPPDDEKDQVLWAGFDTLELGPSCFKRVLLIGYTNGFQVLGVEDAFNVCELVSRRDGPVTFLQMQPTPVKSESTEGFIASHPMLLVVAGDETNGSGMVQGGRLSAFIKESASEPQQGNYTPTVVRFYSLKSHNYVHVLRFRSAVYIVRCSPQVVAVALAAQIYCFDAVTLENKFSVLTYPIQGAAGVNIGYGPMAVGPRWLAYASNNPLLTNTGRLSPQNLTPSPGVSPSTSPSSGNLVARYAMESSKQLAAGILNLGDAGYKTLSKYYQELLPDNSTSPLSSNSGRRSGKFQQTAHPSEPDNAGMVVIKDLISKDVISQFKAHASPISALCFDPSGTLLVTASVHGHNINVFRIMPTRIQNSSGTACYDWSSSHVHLYKLYRGLTAAVIQDICFSHYSQWIAVVSSRGTCHIYVLSPFGGDASLQLQNSESDGPLLMPNLTLPWWSPSCCMIHQQFHPPPPAVTYSVVSRIKNNHSGWLNTVSNVAASATGKISAPSGAIAALFHNSIYQGNQSIPSKVNALEHLLVYSPSGHVIQHELLPSSCAESSDSSSRVVSSPHLQLQEEELRVNAEPVQWWDVCRRSNWPEREEEFSNIFSNQQSSVTVMDTSDCEDNESVHSGVSTDSLAGKESVKGQERSRWYLSNAEVQINSGRIPVWQKSKICFYTITPTPASGQSAEEYTTGEVQIEKLPLTEVEIRRKDLLPVFKQFHNSQSDCYDRGFIGHSYQSSSGHDRPKEKFTPDALASNCEPASVASISDDGLKSTHLQLDGRSISGFYSPVSLQPMKKPIPSNYIGSSVLENESAGSISGLPQNNPSAQMPIKYSENDGSQLHPENHNGFVLNGASIMSNSLPYPARMITDAHSSNNGIRDEVSTAEITNVHLGKSDTSGPHNSEKFTQYFHEGYCKVSELDDCRELTEAVTDADSSSSHCEREKLEEEGDNDDMLGGVFAFSEEG